MIIYKVTNNINGKIYVGLTKQSLKLRWQQHVRASINRPEATYFYRAIKKYSPENFTLEIIDEAKTMHELSDKEIHWIEKLNCCDRKIGYNCKSGGLNNFKVSEETRNKISKALKGRKLSKERIKMCSLANKGNISKNRKNLVGEKYGEWIVIDREFRGDSKKRRAYYKVFNERTKEEKFCIGYSLKQLKKSKKKPVVNSNGEWFESAKKASEIYNVSSSAILNSIKHPNRDEKWKCSGVYWSFQEEIKNDQILW